MGPFQQQTVKLPEGITNKGGTVPIAVEVPTSSVTVCSGFCRDPILGLRGFNIAPMFHQLTPKEFWINLHVFGWSHARLSLFRLQYWHIAQRAESGFPFAKQPKTNAQDPYNDWSVGNLYYQNPLPFTTSNSLFILLWMVGKSCTSWQMMQMVEIP